MRAQGIDMSKYQAPQDLGKPHGIDFKTMLDVVDFLFMRAGFAGSAGGAWTDPRVHEYMKDLEVLLLDDPKPFTFYWYFRDDVSIMDQVNRFSTVVNKYKEVVNLPLIVDAEVFVKSDAVSTQKIKDFQAEVENQTGLLVDILYARSWQLNEETTEGLPEVLPNLFVARYVAVRDPQTSEPWGVGTDDPRLTPRDYIEWAFWQYSEGGDERRYGVTAGAIGIDEVVYNGSVEALRSWAKLDQPVDPPIDWEKWGKTTADRKVSALGPNASILEFFSYDVAWEPQMLSVHGEYRTKVKISLFINGFEIPLRKTIIYSSGSMTYTFLRDFNFSKGDGILVELTNTSGAPATATITLALEKYGDL